MREKVAYAIARESADDKTLQNQYDGIRKAAQSMGYKIIGEFGENVSGDVTKNDGQDSEFIVKLRKAIHERKPDAIFCYWIDRMTRTTYKQGAYLNEFSVIPKIPIYFTRKNRWTINPDSGEIDNDFLAELASDTTPQKERENIVARTTPMREKVAAEGYYIGHLSDGYTVKEEWGLWEDGHRRKLKTIIIDEERRNVIEQIYSLFINGSSTDKIADILNAKDIPTTNRYRCEHHEKFGHRIKYKTPSLDDSTKNRTEAKWSGSLVSRILHNEWYKGIRHYQGIEHHHEAIISEDDWNEAQTIRTERSLTFRSNRETKKHVYLLQGLMFCGKCGCKMYGHYTGLNNHYFCSSIENGSKCGLRGIKKENVEAFVYECCTSNAILSVISGEDDAFSNYFKLNREHEKAIKNDIKNSESIIADCEGQIKDKDRQIQNLINLQAENDGNQELHRQYSNHINQRYNDIQKLRDKITKERAHISKNKRLLITSNNAKNLIRNIRSTRDLSDIKLFFRTVIDKVFVYNAGGRNDIVRICFKTGKATEFMYAPQAMPDKCFPLVNPLYYDEKTNRIKSKEYPVYISDGAPITQSFIERFEKDDNPQSYRNTLVNACKEEGTIRIDEDTVFTVRDYVLHLKSLASYNGIPSYTRLEDIDELGLKQREHYREWRKKYNTGRPSSEPYVLHNQNYEELCLKRKHLYNRRYKIKNNKSLSENEKREMLDEIKYQLDILSAQVPYIEGHERKKKGTH
jgi:site-specific DNA recombinase